MVIYSILTEKKLHIIYVENMQAINYHKKSIKIIFVISFPLQYCSRWRYHLMFIVLKYTHMYIYGNHLNVKNFMQANSNHIRVKVKLVFFLSIYIESFSVEKEKVFFCSHWCFRYIIA